MAKIVESLIRELYPKIKATGRKKLAKTYGNAVIELVQTFLDPQLERLDSLPDKQEEKEKCGLCGNSNPNDWYLKTVRGMCCNQCVMTFMAEMKDAILLGKRSDSFCGNVKVVDGIMDFHAARVELAEESKVKMPTESAGLRCMVAEGLTWVEMGGLGGLIRGVKKQAPGKGIDALLDAMVTLQLRLEAVKCSGVRNAKDKEKTAKESGRETLCNCD